MSIKKAELWRFVRVHGRLEAARAVLAKAIEADNALADKDIVEMRLAVIGKLFQEADGFLGPDSPLAGSVGIPLNVALTHGDVLLLIGQLLACLDAYKAQRVLFRHERWYWAVAKDGSNEIEYVPVDPAAKEKKED